LFIVFQNGFTALVLASQAGHQDVVQALLKARARLNHQTKVTRCMQGSTHNMLSRTQVSYCIIDMTLRFKVHSQFISSSIYEYVI